MAVTRAWVKDRAGVSFALAGIPILPVTTVQLLPALARERLVQGRGVLFNSCLSWPGAPRS